MDNYEGNPLRFTEEDLYNCLCIMREANVGPTSAQHLLEALHFLDRVAKFKYLNLTDVVSSRCKGAARDQFLQKRLLEQKSPLSAHLVKRLEVSIRKLNPLEACILGQLLFCVHASARWADSLRITKLWSEESGGEILVHADAAGSKNFGVVREPKDFFLMLRLGWECRARHGRITGLRPENQKDWIMVDSFYRAIPRFLESGPHPP